LPVVHANLVVTKESTFTSKGTSISGSLAGGAWSVLGAVCHLVTVTIESDAKDQFLGRSTYSTIIGSIYKFSRKGFN